MFTFAQKKDTASLGIYVNSIYDFRLNEKSFMADMWLWINYKNDSLELANIVEIQTANLPSLLILPKRKKVNVIG